MKNHIQEQIDRLTKYQQDLLEEHKTDEALRVSAQIIELSQINDDKVLLTEQEAADLLDIKVTFLQKIRKQGKIKAVRSGRSYKYSRRAIDQYIENEEELALEDEPLSSNREAVMLIR